MSGLPRILTVDPSGSVARLLRAVVDLTDQMWIQTDVPNGVEALSELSRAPYHLVVSALVLDEEMDGLMLAAQAQTQSPEVGVVLIADDEDPDAEPEGHAVVLRRPLDPHLFLRVLTNGLNGSDLLASVNGASAGAALSDIGVVPDIDLAAVGKIIDRLLLDITPLTLILATRDGEVLLERGREQRLDRDSIAQALLPAMHATIQMGSVVGGKVSAMNFYDGDHYDIFMLAVGYHHFLCLVFAGNNGSKQIGAVRSYAQRAVQDIVALLGGQAYTIHAPSSEIPRTRTKAARAVHPVPDVAQELEPVAVRGESLSLEPDEPPAVELERLQLDPIEDFDPNLLDQLDALNEADADEMFSLDSLAEIAKTSERKRDLLSDDEARRLGIVQ